MLIRSQDKKRIATDLNLEILHESWDSNEWEIVNNAVGVIGIYSTEEKAIKVLDMIQDAYIQYAAIKNDFGDVRGVFNLPKCFQMPQDREV